MKISEVKKALNNLEEIRFILPDGHYVPGHFHVTEIGKVQKDFIDCGGTVRSEEVANFQLWSANDYDHRLHPEKLQQIIELSEKILKIGDLDIEVEYQGETIGKFGLDFDGTNFLLSTEHTDCLAKESCGIPVEDVTAGQNSSGCEPGSGCC